MASAEVLSAFPGAATVAALNRLLETNADSEVRVAAVTMTWRDQAAASTGIDIRPVPEGRRGMTPGKSMLYPTASVILEAIRAIPAGEAISPRELRDDLARRHDVGYTCPVTTARNLRLLAEATNEAHQAGTPPDELAPIWRVLNAKAAALRNVTFDPAWIFELRQRETVSS